MISHHEFFMLVRDAHIGMLNRVKADVKDLKRIKVNGKQYISIKDLNDLLNGYTRKPSNRKNTGEKVVNGGKAAKIA